AAGDWQLMFALLHQEKAPPDEMQRRGFEVAEALRGGGQAREAGRVLAEYCSDTDEAVAAFCEARAWAVAGVLAEYCSDTDEAVEGARVTRAAKREELVETCIVEGARVARAAKREDLVETCIVPGLLDAADAMSSDLKQRETQLEYIIARLSVVSADKV
ncbi:hypothetical protein T484DRAFT_1759586, partial [Baffinella frigidus]